MSSWTVLEGGEDDDPLPTSPLKDIALSDGDTPGEFDDGDRGIEDEDALVLLFEVR